MVLAGVSAIELGNQSISAVLIDSMLQQISRWGIPGTSNLTATIQSVQSVDLPSVCTLQVSVFQCGAIVPIKSYNALFPQVAAVPAGLNVTSGVNVTVLVNAFKFNVYIAVALSEALLVP